MRAAILAGRFELGEPAGAGGGGTVFRARDRETGGAVAVKLLAVDDVVDSERFVSEATALSSLAHPGIVRYVEHGVTGDDEHFLVMEWIDGESLARRLAREGVTIRESVQVVCQVANALAEAHRHGLIHRDIKPDNIMLADGALDRTRVVDFGLARFLADDRKLTRTGVVVGTPGYMAPEQVRGARGLDGRADQFALGCVLYECIAGRGAFLGENLMALQLKVLMVEPPALATLRSEVSFELSAIVQRAMAKDPVDRFATLDDFRAALAGLPLTDLQDHERRQTVADAPHTSLLPSVLDRTPAGCVVMAVPRRPDVTWPARATEAASQWHVGRDLLQSGALVIRHREPADAARCALELARALPDATVVVATPSAGPAKLEDVVDRATKVMSVAALRSVIARASATTAPTAPIVDAVTARRLGDAFEIVAEGDRYLLRGEHRHG